MSDSALNQVMAALEQLQLENESLRRSLHELQNSTTHHTSPVEPHLSSASNPTPSSSHPYVLEPNVSLPDKFNGSRAHLRGFINQIRLIIRLQPQRYASDFSRVGLVGTLLSGPAQAWFAPLMETSSPLLDNFPAFLAELEATFGETDRRRTAVTKLYSLQQGSRPASIYASEFRQIACDVNWDDQALCDQFRRGLRNDVKTLLLNFPEPTSLSQVISQAVQCDNRLFELRQEERGTRGFPSSSRNVPLTRPYISVSPSTPRLPSSNDSLTRMEVDSRTPMEIDHARFQPLTDVQRQHRRDNGLCLYCGGPGHVIRHCPMRGPRHQPHRARLAEVSQQRENDRARPAVVSGQQENEQVRLQ